MVVSYEVENDKRLERRLKEAKRKVSDLRFAFGEIARDWWKSNKTQFNLKSSGLYPPLSPEYDERKRKLAGRNLPILVGADPGGGESGRLRDSVSGTPNSDSILVIRKLFLVLGTSVPHAPYVQGGTSRMPERKFMFIGPEAPRAAGNPIRGRLSRWLQILEADVARQLKSAGLNVKKRP